MARILIDTATTDSNGVASTTIDGVGSGEVDLIVASGSLSDTIELRDYIKYDIYNSLSVDDYVLRYPYNPDTLPTGDTLTATNDYKTFTTTSSSGRRCYLDIGDLSEVKFTLEAKFTTSGNIGVCNNSKNSFAYNTFSNNDWLYIEFVQANGTVSMRTSTDGETWTSITPTQGTAISIRHFMITVVNGSVSFRNLRIEPR